MAIVFTDQEIDSMVQERKIRRDGRNEHIRLNNKPGHAEYQLIMDGASGSIFRLILRQSMSNLLDFSLILAVQLPQSNQVFRLRRYNGNSHEHTNDLENCTFRNFHIHIATERYQEIGTREDAYAEATDRYSDFHSAFHCLTVDTNLEVSLDPQRLII